MPVHINKVWLLGLWILGNLAACPVLGQSANRSRVVSYQTIPAPEPEDVLLQQCILYGNGNSQCNLLLLPHQFALVASASSGAHNLFLLRKSYADTVQLLLTDSLGKVQRQPRRFMQRMNNYFYLQPKLLGLPNDQGFILTYPTGNAKNPVINVVRLGIDLEVRWQQQVANKEFTKVVQLAADDSHLWLYLLRTIGPVTTQPQIWVAQLASGQPTGTIVLTPTEAVEAAVLVPAGLLMLGSTHRNYLPKPPTDQPEPIGRRRDIVRLITPDGQQPLFETLKWPAPGRPAYHWKTARPLPGGGYEFIGETYREVTDGAAVAMAVLGAGLTGFGYSNGLVPTSGYVNQRPVGLLVAQLGPAGVLANVRHWAVPEAMHLSAADSSQALPKGRPTDFRYRGQVDHRYVVLNTSRQVLLYSFDRNCLMPLMPARRSTPTVLSIEPGYINVGWTKAPGEAIPDVEHVPLP